jgi:hypothetical protein
MPAHRRRPLASFRHCRWRPRLGRLYVETFRRLQRRPVGSALDGDASGVSRGSLSGTDGGLIGVARQLLTGGDVGGDLVDASRYLLLTRSDPVDALPNCVDVAQHPVEPLLIGESGR